MPPAPTIDPPQRSATAAFLAGFGAAWLSVMAYVLIGTYIGLAALAHDFGFSLWWLAASTVLVWAGPAQVILVSALGAGAAAWTEETPAEVRGMLRSRANTIEGGTSEVMRNILGERVLGLPGDLRADAGMPWKEIPRG